MSFIPITKTSEWLELKEASEEKPIAIFKHSKQCGTSTESYDALDRAMLSGEIKENIYLVDVHEARTLSNEIAVDLELVHESPQIIIIRAGKRIYSADHQAIIPEFVGEELL
jgi:bacillithiol system protein YtxJ